jgi:hypothetical protein
MGTHAGAVYELKLTGDNLGHYKADCRDDTADPLQTVVAANGM